MFDWQVAQKIAEIHRVIWLQKRQKPTISLLMEAIIESKNDKDSKEIFERDRRLTYLKDVKAIKTYLLMNVRNILSGYVDEINSERFRQFTEKVGSFERNQQLEKKLTQRFPIRYAVVLKTHESTNYNLEEQSADTRDIHEVLGPWGRLVLAPYIGLEIQSASAPVGVFTIP